MVTGTPEVYRCQQLKPHTCTVAGAVQYVPTTAVASDLLFAPILPPFFLRSSFFSPTHMHTFMVF